MNKLLGKITYITTYPGIRLMLWRSRRAYVVVKVGDEILVTENWLGLHNKWRLPGGGLKKGEAPQLGAARELFEEVGIIVAPEDLHQIGNPKGYTAYSKCHYWLFLAELPTKPKLAVDTRELTKAEFVPLNVLQNTSVAEEITEVLAAILP